VKDKEKIVRRFMAFFDVPEFVEPFIDRIVEEREMDLLLAMMDDSLTADQIAGRLDLSLSETRSCLERAYSRSLISRETDNGAEFYSTVRFYNQLDTMATFEDWRGLPDNIRRQLGQWQIDRYVEMKREDVDRKKREGPDSVVIGNDIIMLLDELDEVIDAAHEIVVLPCDCRSVNEQCERPKEVCIWMDRLAETLLSKGKGRRIGKDEALRIVEEADQAGLMHTVNGDWRSNGPTEICSCCSSDCYPFRASRVLGAKGIWPRSCYIARHDEDVCVRCGRCAARCHFSAFARRNEEGSGDGNGVSFDAKRCWGCGLCANTCPAGAITMEPLGGESKWL